MKLNKICILFFCAAIFFLDIPVNAADTTENAPTVKSDVTRQADTKRLQLSGHMEHGVRIIEVQAFKYGYNPDPIVIKAGEKVKLLLTSKDVTHGFGITDLNINVKIPPKKTTPFEFVANKPGSYRIYCTVFCGLGHATMHGTLVVIK